jgi:autoinducer 2-degrading protein
MHVTCVHVHVKPEAVAAFVAATRENHEHSVQEPGNRRFDVLQDPADPARFLLYEAYATAEDAAAHKATPHYLKWRDTVADMMAEPRRGVGYTGLFPAEPAAAITYCMTSSCPLSRDCRRFEDDAGHHSLHRTYADFSEELVRRPDGQVSCPFFLEKSLGTPA